MAHLLTDSVCSDPTRQLRAEKYFSQETRVTSWCPVRSLGLTAPGKETSTLLPTKLGESSRPVPEKLKFMCPQQHTILSCDFKAETSLYLLPLSFNCLPPQSGLGRPCLLQAGSVTSLVSCQDLALESSMKCPQTAFPASSSAMPLIHPLLQANCLAFCSLSKPSRLSCPCLCCCWSLLL